MSADKDAERKLRLGVRFYEVMLYLMFAWITVTVYEEVGDVGKSIIIIACIAGLVAVCMFWSAAVFTNFVKNLLKCKCGSE